MFLFIYYGGDEITVKLRMLKDIEFDVIVWDDVQENVKDVLRGVAREWVDGLIPRCDEDSGFSLEADKLKVRGAIEWIKKFFNLED